MDATTPSPSLSVTSSVFEIKYIAHGHRANQWRVVIKTPALHLPGRNLYFPSCLIFLYSFGSDAEDTQDGVKVGVSL